MNAMNINKKTDRSSQNGMFPNIADPRGFTLVEVMVTLVISSIVFAGIYTAFRSQQKSTDTQIQIAEAQQNLRAATLLMTRELRMAGFDPTEDAGASIVNATANSIHLTMDIRGNAGGPDKDGDGIPDPDGATNDSDEDITYSLYVDADGVSKLGRAAPALNRPVAENIEALQFFYTLADGTTTLAPADPDLIRSVKVSLVARSDREDLNIVNNTTSFTMGSGAIWTPPNPNTNHFRYRFLTTTIECRNMGYKEL